MSDPCQHDWRVKRCDGGTFQDCRKCGMMVSYGAKLIVPKAPDA